MTAVKVLAWVVLGSLLAALAFVGAAIIVDLIILVS